MNTSLRGGPHFLTLKAKITPAPAVITREALNGTPGTKWELHHQDLGSSPSPILTASQLKGTSPNNPVSGFQRGALRSGGKSLLDASPRTPRRPRPSLLAGPPPLPRGEAVPTAFPGPPGSARPGRCRSTCRQAPPPAARSRAGAPGLRGSASREAQRTQLFTLPKVPTPSVSPST